MSNPRLLYLHNQHLIVDSQRATTGNLLLNLLRAEFGHVIPAHMVVEDETTRTARTSFLDDVITLSELHDEHIDVIFFEGGLESSFSGDGGLAWKMKVKYLKEFVERGGVAIVSDVDINFASSSDDRFHELSSVSFKTASQGRRPVYFVDPGRSKDAGWRRINVDVEVMKPSIAAWLSVVFDGVTELLVDGPLELDRCQTPLAYVRSDTMGSMCSDMWWSSPRVGFESRSLLYHPDGPMGWDLSGPFASVNQFGRGFFVTMTGFMSHDQLVTQCPGNARLILNLARHLSAVSTTNLDRIAFQRFRGVRLFLSHRSSDKAIVEDVNQALRKRGIRVWLDKERLLPSDSVGVSINNGLDQSSHFVLFWSKSCSGAPWVEFELGAAITNCVESRKPILIISLDDAPLPPAIRQFSRIGRHTSAEETAKNLVSAILALGDRGDAFASD